MVRRRPMILTPLMILQLLPLGHKPSQRKQQWSPLPKSKEGGKGSESDGEDPPVNDVEEGDSATKESGEKESVVE
ncbi:hypothetical protein HAX54_000360, partial [Datura stramonium]|nr:hypothetical protein [Datura stramonium]